MRLGFVSVLVLLIATSFISQHRLLRSSDDAARVARDVIDTSGILATLTVLFCFVLVARHLRGREEAEATLLRMQQGLEERVEERTGELARLAASLQTEVAERREIEKQLRESEQRYRLVAKASNGTVWDWNLVSDRLQWSEGAKTIFGYASEAIRPEEALDRVHPDDKERVIAGVRAVLNSGQDYWSDEYRHKRADGSYADVLSRGQVVRDPEGKPLRLIGSTLDLTEHRQAERALQESERRYRMLFEDSPLPMLVYEAETLNLLAVNTAAEELFGYTRAEFLKMTLRDLSDPAELPAFLDRMKELGRFESYKTLDCVHRKEGQSVTIESRGHIIQFGGRRAWLSLITDITEQKRLESQLQQSQKMEAVGRLAGGIAHDFNNLLTVILGYSDSILRKLDRRDPVHGKVAEIQAAGRRAADLTGQLLAFSRKQILQPQTLELNKVVSNISQMLRRVLGEDVHVTLHLDAALGQIRADPAQLEQVLVNLSVNARDAMPDGGKLLIETHNAEITPEAASLQGIPAGQYVLLAVSDTGFGMDEATKAKIFEPFFTTKEVGKGTGLGLSMVLGVVQQSGGSVTVYSEPGVGTTFRLYLPRADNHVVQFAELAQKVLPAANKETILLVEDEDRVRALACVVLQEAGYTVLEATNGLEALEIAGRSEIPPALLLTDVVMPKLNGLQLAQQLRDKWPNLPVVFTSGYTDHALLGRGGLRKDAPFLQKPYTSASLLEQVATVLERAMRRSREAFPEKTGHLMAAEWSPVTPLHREQIAQESLA